jgi:hypothetical protein
MSDSTEQKFITHAEFEAYKKELEKKFGQKKEKKTRAPNAYNLFMKDEVAKLKAKDPSLKNQDAFKQSAANWSKEHKKDSKKD